MRSREPNRHPDGRMAPSSVRSHDIAEAHIARVLCSEWIHLTNCEKGTGQRTNFVADVAEVHNTCKRDEGPATSVGT